jgi:hypothetical protein
VIPDADQPVPGEGLQDRADQFTTGRGHGLKLVSHAVLQLAGRYVIGVGYGQYPGINDVGGVYGHKAQVRQVVRFEAGSQRWHRNLAPPGDPR